MMNELYGLTPEALWLRYEVACHRIILRPMRTRGSELYSVGRDQHSEPVALVADQSLRALTAPCGSARCSTIPSQHRQLQATVSRYRGPLWLCDSLAPPPSIGAAWRREGIDSAVRWGGLHAATSHARGVAQGTHIDGSLYSRIELVGVSVMAHDGVLVHLPLCRLFGAVVVEDCRSPSSANTGTCLST